MKIHAYVLAADPTWLRRSVGAYYHQVDKLVVSYDVDGLGFTGSPVRTEECLAILRALDVDRKIQWTPGVFSFDPDGDYLAVETRQRKSALAHASREADWVLQIDTDEVLPSWAALRRALDTAEALQIPAVEWPMRVLYRRLRGGSYLEVATSERTTHFEYPGPIAVRPDIELADCRRTSSEFLRPVVAGDRFSLQVRRTPEPAERRAEVLQPSDAIWHNSWARSRASVRRKIASWGHNQGARSWLYYYVTWLPSPVTWPALRQVHPLVPSLWPRLRRCGEVTVGLDG